MQVEEAKWFRCLGYEVDGHVVLTCGRSTPAQGRGRWHWGTGMETVEGLGSK